MKAEYKLLIIGLIAVAILEILGALAAKFFGFSYTYLALASLMLYASVGFFAEKLRDLKIGVLFGAILALFDATLGWKLAVLVNPTLTINFQPSNNVFIAAVISMVLLGTLLGFIGALVSKFMNRKI